jgi:CheY-like chemotaxis protein
MGRLAGRRATNADERGEQLINADPTIARTGFTGFKTKNALMSGLKLWVPLWPGSPMDTQVPKHMQARVEALKVLLVDDDPNMRKVVRTMLAGLGIRQVYEASDGLAGLEAIRALTPDLVIVDWEMPMLDGAQFVRMVRSPNDFPYPDVPIIILTGHGDRWRVVEAAKVGVHEYLLKPVSTKALMDRIVTILAKPRPTVKMEGYYGPAPRKLVFLEERVPDPEEEARKSGNLFMVH